MFSVKDFDADPKSFISNREHVVYSFYCPVVFTFTATRDSRMVFVFYFGSKNNKNLDTNLYFCVSVLLRSDIDVYMCLLE